MDFNQFNYALTFPHGHDAVLQEVAVWGRKTSTQLVLVENTTYEEKGYIVLSHASESSNSSVLGLIRWDQLKPVVGSSAAIGIPFGEITPFPSSGEDESVAKAVGLPDTLRFATPSSRGMWTQDRESRKNAHRLYESSGSAEYSSLILRPSSLPVPPNCQISFYEFVSTVIEQISGFTEKKAQPYRANGKPLSDPSRLRYTPIEEYAASAAVKYWKLRAIDPEIACDYLRTAEFLPSKDEWDFAERYHQLIKQGETGGLGEITVPDVNLEVSILAFMTKLAHDFGRKYPTE